MSVYQQTERRRFGIGEWYGRSFINLSASERRFFAELQSLPRAQRPPQPCPFQSTSGRIVHCSKEGGVCSLRLYSQSLETNVVTPVSGESGRLRTTCPNRFEEDGMIYRWVGETLLGCPAPVVLREIGFLSAVGDDHSDSSADDVGRIDEVLVVPGVEPLVWCALEVQAVYFQGAAMSREYGVIANQTSEAIPFPVGSRRPDYRSSGPKRLMPQLQIKVPSLRRWGKKTAVVVDQDFFAVLGRMETVDDVSNCDIAWFVVAYDESGRDARLVPHAVHLTTLEHAVEGLTAGKPVSLEVFEQRLREKLARRQVEPT